MQLTQALSHLRERIGDPPVDYCSDEELLSYLTSALMWLADELKYVVRTDPYSIALTASTYEYPLPNDLSYLIRVEHNSLRLRPATVSDWVREGVDWENATAATPFEYAILGRNLILNPPPSSSAITSDAILTISYIATAPALGARGPVPFLTDADIWPAIYRAAVEYCGIHTAGDQGQMAAMQARQQTSAAMLQQVLPHARRRAQNPLIHHAPRLSVQSRWTGAAR